MNLDTMGECIHYEFSEKQPINWTVYTSQVRLWHAYQNADRWNGGHWYVEGPNEILESYDSSGCINAFGILRGGYIVNICAHTRTNKKSFRQFCEVLANAQGHFQAKEVAA